MSDPLDAPGAALDAERLLGLRHLVAHIPERRLSPVGAPGDLVSKRRGRGLETVDIREFCDGDDIRHIDRNATARTGVTHVRTFRDERERRVLLLADFRRPMLWGTRRALRSVAAAEALALVGWRVAATGGRAGVIAFGGGRPFFAPMRGRERGMASVIGAMVEAHAAALAEPPEAARETPPLTALLERAAAVAPRGGTVILATGLDRPGEGFEALALALGRRAQLRALLVMDAFERHAPPGLYPVATEQGRTFWAEPPRHARAGAALAEDRRSEYLLSIGVNVTMVDAADEPETLAETLERIDDRIH